ncbi:MAG: hypothetical protein CM1200mP28_02720 [Deltaproteobacteria bacterium]|nr:MAG: hypothetical protein CM1200mP28_02720 [Deltaproteobacteria bacterium]
MRQQSARRASSTCITLEKNITDQRLDTLMQKGGISDCGKRKKCVEVCPQKPFHSLNRLQKLVARFQAKYGGISLRHSAILVNYKMPACPKILTPKNPKRFLLVRTDRVGDTILTLPAVTALRKKSPQAFISFLAHPYTVPLIEQYEGIDLLLTYEPEGRHRGWQGVLKLGNQLGNLNFDVVLLFYPRPELAFALWLAKIPLRIGTGFRGIHSC